MSNVTATGHLRGFARLPLEAGRRRSPLGWRSVDAVRSVAEPDAELIPSRIASLKSEACRKRVASLCLRACSRVLLRACLHIFCVARVRFCVMF